MDEYAQEEFEQADNALADAKKLRRSGGTDRAVVNRLYYACFHAATAILHTRGCDPKTHRGVISVFGEELVMANEVAREDGRFLNAMRTRREIADYEHEPIEGDLDTMFERTERFIGNMNESAQGK